MGESLIPIAVAYGDGIGPEIMEATLSILSEAGAPLAIQKVEIGEKVYLSGYAEGIAPESWEVLRKTRAFLKAPITTPQGGGFRSLNVTIRTALGLFANVRPCVSYHPVVKTKHPGMDVVIVRENEEDLYAGIEYRQTPHVAQSLKIISREGSERVIRYAFEYARRQGRRKVTCFTKDNIMKFSDGLFHRVFLEVAKEYPDLEHEHWIVDIGAAKLADTPESFDVIVLPNLYGDILSDVAAQIAGSVGLAGSANIGMNGAMFEAIHGSAPRRAGQDMANPSGLLLASVLMLQYLGEGLVAQRIHNAWLRTIEEGIHTYDIFVEGKSKRKVGTREFAQAVIKFLGEKPELLPEVALVQTEKFISLSSRVSREEDIPPSRILQGVDVYVYSREDREIFLKNMLSIQSFSFDLVLVTNRGMKVWPEGGEGSSCIEQWRCRYLPRKRDGEVLQMEIVDLLKVLTQQGVDVIKTENLYKIDGVLGYSSEGK